MAFSRYNRGRPFLVVTRLMNPAEGERTETKNWKATAKWKIDESILIVDRVNDKHMEQATVIIDILQRKSIKHRFDATDDEVVTAYLTTYKQEISDGIATWLRSKTNNDKEATEILIADLEDELAALKEIEIEVKP